MVSLTAVLQRALEKAIGIQHSPVASYVALLRRARPDATPAEIIAVLEKQYLAAVTGTGAAAGGVAAVPGIGTVLGLTLSGGERAVFFEATTLFALALAEVHGIRAEEVQRRQTLVLDVVFGDHSAPQAEETADQTDQPRGDQPCGDQPCGDPHRGDPRLYMLPISLIAAINKPLSRWFVTKFGSTQAALVIGRIAPLGIGAAAWAAGNRGVGLMMLDASRRVFGPPPPNFPDHTPAKIPHLAAN
ncbi:MAG: hypothetical protein ACT4NY_34010 [Pseudonocardiales bacterium]